MPAPADVEYARTRDGIDIAYTVFGEGPDLLVAPGFVTHLDMMWDLGGFRPLLDLGAYFRVTVFDKRGTGLSDRSLGCGSLEERAEDLCAVADAVGAETAILYGISEGGPMCIYFAATHPERVRALILQGTSANFDGRAIRPDDPKSPIADPERFVNWLEEVWGKGEAYGLFMSHPPDAEACKRVHARYERAACTRQMCRSIMEMNLQIDVTPLLPSVKAETLVVHCTDDPLIPFGNARRLAEGIPNAELVPVDGDFHGSWSAEDNVLTGRAMLPFLARHREGEGDPSKTAIVAREVASVLFTDIVSSTERAAQVGDAQWRSMLERYEAEASRVSSETGGALVKTTGDGVVATFGSPSQAVVAARALQDAALPLGVRIRAGVHTGEIERRADDIAGMGVHIAARVSAIAEAGEILVSRTTRDIASGSHLVFEDRGIHEFKGVPEPWQVYAVV